MPIPKRYVACNVLFAALQHPLALFTALAFLAVGCAEDFDPGSLLADLRVLAVETNVDDDVNRANPFPGETLQLRVGAFGPRGDETFTWAATACLSLGAPFGGVAPCEGAPIQARSELSPTSQLPTFPVSLPDDAAERGRMLQVFGLVCPAGEPNFDLLAQAQPDLGGDLCLNPAAPGEPFVLTVDFEDPATGNTPNQRPVFAEGAFTVGGEPWPGSAETGQACLDSSPRFSRETTPQVDITIAGFSPEDRESFQFFSTEPVELLSDREALLVSHFTSAGELERQFSSIDDDNELVQRVEWELPDPAEIPSEGLSVRFIFVVRDRRGGTSWVERNLCVLP